MTLFLAAGLLVAFRVYDPLLVFGKVVDNNGSPIAGVVVTVKGGKTSAVTNAQGAFAIIVPDSTATLVVSTVGFVTKETRFKMGKDLVVKLKPMENHLDEVVVTGYGTARSEDAENLDYLFKRKDAVQLEQMLPGKVAGVQISNGSPGNSTYMRIRGQATLSNSNLYGSQAPMPLVYEDISREGYDKIEENAFKSPKDEPLSTFSTDVDQASYTNIRRLITSGVRPPDGAVRVEELINYFHYERPQPKAGEPFSITTEMAACPWNHNNRLVMIGLQGRKIETQNLPPSNLVFLVDVSGSMSSPDKLPLVQQSLRLLTSQLREQDRVTLVAYAGAAGLVLPPTSGANKGEIISAIDRLSAGGSTAGGQGIRLAYAQAKKNYLKEGNNRVILCTDGDFNVGESSDDAMERLIEEERKSGVYLSVLGFGTGNYQDAKMQKIADKGNGNHSYVDRIETAKKVFVDEFGGTMFTIANDVKVQVEFNPRVVRKYRLVGYENRVMAKEDFNDDRKDAGDIGSGHAVTALYEVEPAGSYYIDIPAVDPLKYQQVGMPTTAASAPEAMTVKLRYKKPGDSTSRLISVVVNDGKQDAKKASDDFRFASAVAAYGQLLRHSKFSGKIDYHEVLRLANGAMGADQEGYRSDFLKLVRETMKLDAVAFDPGEEEEEDGSR